MRISTLINTNPPGKVYIVEVSAGELMGIKLNDVDRKLLDECEKSEKVSDKLLALELLVRKIEENQ